MRIFRALGTGIFLLIIASLMPEVFSELAKTAISFLQSSQQAFTAAGILASYAGHLPLPLH
jgi:ribosomal protein L11 methylase PrmA